DVAIAVIAGGVFLRHHGKPEIFQAAFDVHRRALDVGIGLVAAHPDVAGQRLDVALESRSDQLLIWRERRYRAGESWPRHLYGEEPDGKEQQRQDGRERDHAYAAPARVRYEADAH